MKKIFILLFTAAVAITAGCKKEEHVTLPADSEFKAPVLTAPAAETKVAVTADNGATTVDITWDKASYGVQAVVSYFVQLDVAGNSFKGKINLASTSTNKLTVSLSDLNDKLLNTLKLPANAESAIEVRTGSTLYGKDSIFSKPVKLLVTTYKELAPAKLYVAGAYQGWNPAAAPNLYPVTTFAFEGYVYMGGASEFKFTTAPDFSHVNYGDGGAGKLGFTEPGPSLYVGVGGYYKLNADVKNLTVGITLIKTFGIIGTATPHNWDASTAMTFDTSTGKWSITVDLKPGALKFRANDDWGINYGPADSNALNGTLIQTDGAITINDAGSYTVTIDMGQVAGAKYSYTVVKH